MVRRRGLVIAVVVATGVLGACSGSSDHADPSTTTVPTPATVPSTTATTQPPETVPTTPTTAPDGDIAVTRDPFAPVG